MTDNHHPITPPPELVREWAKTCSPYEVPADHIAIQAARWGADQELEACCEWLEDADLDDSQKVSWVNLRAARRPKPPNLKELALEVLDDIDARLDAVHYNILRRAIEFIPD